MYTVKMFSTLLSNNRRETYGGERTRRPVVRVRGIPSTLSRGELDKDFDDMYQLDDDADQSRRTTFTSFQNKLPGGSTDETNWKRSLIQLLNRVNHNMERTELRMEMQDAKDTLKLEWQQAALVIDT